MVAPWTLRNWIVYGAFVPVSTAGALNLWQGNAPVSREEVYEQYWAVHGRIEKYRFARAKGLEAIRERQPGWLFEKLAQEMPNFWEADSQALVHVVRGAYGPYKKPAVAVAAVVVVLAPFFAVLVVFVFGLAALPERGPLLLVAFLAYYVPDPRGHPRLRALSAARDARALPARGLRLGGVADGRLPGAHACAPARGPPRRSLPSRSPWPRPSSRWFTEPWDKPAEAGEVREEAS